MSAAESTNGVGHAYAWETVSKGQWRRKLFGMEPYFVFFGNLTSSMVNGREHYTICTTVKLAKAVDSQILQQAWKQLRFEQPKLASVVEASDWTMHYSVPNEEQVSTWLSETYHVVSDKSYDEMYPDFEPVKTGTLYWLPTTNELIFRGPHWQVDGIGSWLFWDAFFKSLEKVHSAGTASISWGEETARLAPVMKEIWKIGELNSAAQQSGQVMFGNWAANVPGAGPEPISKTPTKCQKIEIEYDQTKTSSIINASKKQGLSVTAAFHAAFAIANEKASPAGGEKKNYATMSNINFRKYLGTPYTSSSQALNVYYAPIPLVMPVETFDKTAAAMNQFYKQTYDESEKLEEVCAYFDFLFQVAQSPEFLGAPVPGDAMLSSLGVVEKYVQRSYANGLIEISDLHNGIDVVLGMSLAFLYTFDGKLRFTYCYNEGLQPAAVVASIVDSTKEIFEQGLGI